MLLKTKINAFGRAPYIKRTEVHIVLLGYNFQHTDY